jgi:hypothetical protein
LQHSLLKLQIKKKKPITNDKIQAVPDKPQQVLIICLVQKIVDAALVKTEKLCEDINYMLKTTTAAFESHSTVKLDKALTKRKALVR